MRTVGFILLALIAQSCFYHSYYKDNEWWYFEEWDTNHDSMLDKNEFTAGIEKSKLVQSNDKPGSSAFAMADDDKDNELSAIEFYKWEISL